MNAALNPGRVAALIHVDIEPKPPDWNRKYLLGLYRNLPDSYATPEDYIAETARNAPYARAETLRELAARSLVFRDGRWFRTYDREILSRFDTYDLTGHLASIRCPALVIRGAESRVLGREVQAVEVPPEQHVGALVEGGFPPQIAEIFAEMYAFFRSGKVRPVGDRHREMSTPLEDTLRSAAQR